MPILITPRHDILSSIMRSTLIVALCIVTLLAVLADLVVLRPLKSRAAGLNSVERVRIIGTRGTVTDEIVALSCFQDSDGQPQCFVATR
jgi:hypothetical protein